MYGRFTDRARKAMQLANKRASQLDREFVGEDDILLGLLEAGGVAATALSSLGVTLEVVHTAVGGITESGSRIVQLPTGPVAMAVIERANNIADKLHHNYVGTEHLLLSLVHVPGSLVERVLWHTNAALNRDCIHERVLSLLQERRKDATEPRNEPWAPCFYLVQDQESGAVAPWPVLRRGDTSLIDIEKSYGGPGSCTEIDKVSLLEAKPATIDLVLELHDQSQGKIPTRNLLSEIFRAGFTLGQKHPTAKLER